MYWNGKLFIPFDIETTSLSAVNGDFVSAVFKVGDSYKLAKNLNDFEDIVKEIKDKMYNKAILVTFNGENYYSGFDIPFLRTAFLKQKKPWLLKEMDHLDIYPLIKKYLNTTVDITKPTPKSRLLKEDIEKLAKANNLKYDTKKKTLAAILEKKNIDWLDYQETKSTEKNDLQSVYQFFFDPMKKEEYIDGADTNKLVKAGKVEEVYRHNFNDVIRTNKLLEEFIDFFPSKEVWNSIRRI
jgi:hypothetical protein